MLAIWLGAAIEHVRFEPWVLGGLAIAALLCAIVRVARRAPLSVIANSPIAALWVVTRFAVTPALLLVATIWGISLLFGLSISGALTNAFFLLLLYGVSAILATSVLADLTAAIKGPGRTPPSGD